MKYATLALASAVLIFTSACGKKDQPAGDGRQNQKTYFRLPNAAGGEIDLAAYSGKPVMLMFFTETCPFCRKAAPALEKLSKTYGPRGMNFLGICIQDDAVAALNFAKDLGITFPLAYDGRDAYRLYRAQGVPYIYLLDKDHNVYDVWEGYDESYYPMLGRSIEAVLAKK